MTTDRKYRGGKVDPADSDAPATTDPMACRARGCPLRGCVDFGNAGKFFCTAHSRALASEWNAITQRIKAQIGMVQFLSELQQRISFPSQFPLESWYAFSVRYWGTDTHCVPGVHEGCNPHAYAYRMLGELQWRVEAIKNRPQPWEPPGSPVPGNVGQLVEPAKTSAWEESCAQG